jgi:thioredoxin-related protein
MKKYFFFGICFLVFTAIGKAQSVPTADAVLKKAYAQAAKENKKLLIIFHASWCGWCHKMDASLNDSSVKDFFDKNYVITHLTVQESDDKKNLENPGAQALNEKWGGGNQGLPFWVVLDQNGKVLGDSQMKPGENVGCPANAEEVAHFINVLKKTSSINESEIAAVEKRFRKNE